MRLFRRYSLARMLVGVLLFCGIAVLFGGIPGWHALATPVLPVQYTASYAGHPLSWSPCANIQIIVNPGLAGTLAFQEVVSVVEEMAVLSGVRMSVVGPTSLVPTIRWALDAPSESHTAPPVIIAWVLPSQTDMFFDGSAGATVANPSTLLGVKSIVTGAIVLDASQFDDFHSGSGGGRTRRNLLLHELGHLLGLSHSRSPVLMNPIISSSTPDGFTSTERSALRQMYVGKCSA